MGDTWQKLNKEETIKVIIIIDEKGNDFQKVLTENCYLCWEDNCDLYGYYGTDNSFGSFRGICKPCLKKLNKISRSQDG